MLAEAARNERPIPAKLNVALLVLASLASASLLHGASHAGSIWLLIACALAFSFTANTLFSLLHEAVHGLFSEHRIANEWAGRIASAWFPTGLAVQRAFHLNHHRNNRSVFEQFDVLHDGDVKWLKRAQWYSILTGLYWPIAVLGVLAYVVTPQRLRASAVGGVGSRAASQTSAQPYLSVLDGLDPVVSRVEVIGSVAAQAALFWLLDLSWLGWAACYAAFAVSWSSLQYTDYAFTPLDAKAGAWNLTVGPVARALFLNYHFHREHHRRPALPWIHLPSNAEPGPRFVDVWREAWKGPRPLGRFPTFPVAAVNAGWAVPTGANAVAAVVFAAVFTVVFVVFFGGASILGGLVPWRFEVAFPFELAIPFRPAWAAVYLSLIPLLLLLPVARPRWPALFPVFAVLVSQVVVASTIFLLLPVQPSFAPRSVVGDGALVFHIADVLNMEGNFFPSLHVAFALTAAIAIGSTVGRPGRTLFHAWAAAIAVSTLLIHEHHLVDIGGGIVLALLTWRCVGRWASRQDVIDAVDVELLCLRNEWLFARRHLRYLSIAAMLWIHRLPRWRARRVLVTGFCFLQAVDDIMDGDRACAQEPLALIDVLSDAIRHDRFGDDGLMRLGKAFIADLRCIGQQPAVDSVLDLMAVMRADRCRAVDASLWSREALREQHRRTFSLSLDLLLQARGCDLRARDAPELIEAFGWCSTMRDLREDLAAGLINVPADVVQTAGFATGAVIDPDALLSNRATQDWIVVERDRARGLLAAAAHRIDALGTRPGVEIFRLFARSIRGFAGQRFERLYPRLRRTAG